MALPALSFKPLRYVYKPYHPSTIPSILQALPLLFSFPRDPTHHVDMFNALKLKWAEKPQHNSCQIPDYQIRYVRRAKPKECKQNGFRTIRVKNKQNSNKTKTKIPD